MKKLVLLSMMFIFFSCSDNQNKIEADLEKVYLSAEEIQDFSGPINLPLQINYDELIELAKNDQSINNSFKAEHRLFIDENGIVVKVKILSDEIKEINKKIAEAQLKLKFEPALVEGEKVKSRFDWSITVPKDAAEKEKYLVTTKYSKPEIYKIVTTVPPEPVGGIMEIQKKIVYPEIAKRAGIEGRVFIKAYINENGLVDKAEIIKGIGAGCDQAAMNAVINTKFVPGMQDDKPVKTQVAIPILFKLQ